LGQKILYYPGLIENLTSVDSICETITERPVSHTTPAFNKEPDIGGKNEVNSF
jgi:hypothetical protein